MMGIRNGMQPAIYSHICLIQAPHDASATRIFERQSNKQQTSRTIPLFLLNTLIKAVYF